MGFDDTMAELLASNRAMRDELRAMRDELHAMRAQLPAPAPVTVAEAARQLNMSEATIRRHLRAGILPLVSVGKRGMRVDLARLKSYDLEDVKEHLRKGA